MGLFTHAFNIPTPPSSLLPTTFLNPSFFSVLDHLPTSYDPSAIKAWYLTANPLHPALLFATSVSVIVFLLGEITRNVSQVDRLWTFLPIVYSVHFTLWPKISGTGPLDERQLLVLALGLLWSARLTTNTYRRGFFNPKSEDYRWEVIRARIPKWQFSLMNLFFVAFIQNFLLLAAELPQYLLLTLGSSFKAHTGYTAPPLGVADWVLAGIFVSILCIEMIADNQQQRYQHFKVAAKELEKQQGGTKDMTEGDKGRLARGFVTFGLWSFSRHPNFACEQATWYIIYAYTVIPFLPTSLTLSTITHHLSSITSAADAIALLRSFEGVLWNYSVWSPLTMTLLFYASTTLTEEISAAKYPLYKEYQQRVGMFWPPITTLKTIWLFVSRQKTKVDDAVFGDAHLVQASRKAKVL